MLFLAAYLYSLLLGALYVAAQTKVAFTSIPSQAYIGSTYNITWAGGDGSPVTITLRKGDQVDLVAVGTLVSNLQDESWEWTVGDDLDAGDDYALQLTQGQSDINYSGQFSILSRNTTSSQSTSPVVSPSGSGSGSGTSDAPSATSASMSSSTTGHSTFISLSTDTTASTTTSADNTRSQTNGPATPSTSTSGSAQSSGNDGIGVGAIAGIVIGAVIAVALVVIAVILVLRYRRAKKTTAIELSEKTNHPLELQSGHRANRHELGGNIASNRDVFHELPGSTQNIVHELSSPTEGGTTPK